MIKMRIVKMVRLDPQRHKRTGAVKHSLNGIEITKLPAALEIASFEGHPGFNLIHLDSLGSEITDTYHESIDKAMLQAEYEFSVASAEWKEVAPNHD